MIANKIKYFIIWWKKSRDVISKDGSKMNGQLSSTLSNFLKVPGSSIVI